MKILAFTNILPFPSNEGGKTAQFVFLKSLVKEHEVVMALNLSEENPDLKLLQEVLPSLKICCYGCVERSNNKSFFVRLIEKTIWNLRKWLPQEPDKKDIINNSFFTNPVKARSPESVQKILEIVSREKPDLVQADFIDNADLAFILPDSLKKLMIIHDLRFSSVFQGAIASGYENSYSKYLSEVAKTSELSYLKKFDGIIAFSEEDAQKLIDSKLDNVYVSPFGIADERFVELSDFYKINKLVFLGPDHHFPNFNSLLWYAEKLSQLVFDKFNLQLIVIGKWSFQNQQKFKRYPTIKFDGYVEDLQAAMDSSVLIVPLRIGSGIRTKILEAFAMGVPVISTTIGSEGIGAANEKEILIADDENLFIQALGKLLNTDIQRSLRRNAQLLVKENFSQDVVYKNRMDIYKKILTEKN